MIIYGYRNREIEKGVGSFFCQKCETTRQYRHKKVVRYFSLFFVPLFPIGGLSEYIECSVCGRTYKPEALSMHTPPNSEPATAFQPILPSGSAPRQNFCLPWSLILFGALFLLFGFIMGLAILLVQSDGAASASMASFILAVLICPAPLAVAGAIGIGGGAFLLRNQESDTQ